MFEVVYMVENRHTNDIIVKMYHSGKITKAECLLLLSTEKDGYFLKYLAGMGEFKLYCDSSVDTTLYYTNVPELLKSFFSCYLKFPNYHFDKMLDSYLLSVSTYPGFVYSVLTLLYHYIKAEIRVFELPNILRILENCKAGIKANTDYFRNTKRYEAKNKPNGYLDVIEGYNCEFKKILNFDLLSDKEDKGSYKESASTLKADIMKKLVYTGWKVKTGSEETEVYRNYPYTNMADPERSYTVRKNGIYYENRGYECTFSDLGSLDNNLLGLYFWICNKEHIKEEIYNAERTIDFKATADEIINAFVEYFGRTFIYESICLQNNSATDNALCFENGEKRTLINYIKDNAYIILDIVTDTEALYRRSFKYLVYKKYFCYELKGLPEAESLSGETILKLFGIFSKNSNFNIRQRDRKEQN